MRFLNNNNKYKISILSIFFSFLSIIILTSQSTIIDLNSHLNDILSSKELSSATIGFYMCDSKTGKEIFSLDANKNLVPASIQKTLITSATLDFFGPQFTFSTNLYTNGVINKGTLNGNLIIKAGGDPTLNSSFLKNDVSIFEVFINAIKSCGISEINGKIIIDISLYDEEEIPATWLWQDIGNYYGAGVFALGYLDNTYYIEFNSEVEIGTSPRIISTTPDISNNIFFENNVIATTINYDNAYIYGSSMSNKRIIRGEIPHNRKRFLVRGALPNPHLFWMNHFIEQLKQSGISSKYEIEVVSKKNYNINNSTLIYSYNSPTLATIVEKTNHSSINLFAEQMYKHLGTINESQSTWELAKENLEIFIKKYNLDSYNTQIYDGSGLSRLNTGSAQFYAQLLHKNRINTKISESFYNSLPIAGQSGTMSSFGGKTLNGKVRAKTGSMTNVHSLAGYINTKTGKEFSFCIIVNNFDCSRKNVRSTIEKLLTEIYNNY